MELTKIIALVKPLIEKFNEKRTFRTFIQLIWDVVPIVEKVVEEYNATLNSPEIKGKSKEDILIFVLDAALPSFPFKSLIIRIVVKQAVAAFNKNGWKI